MLISLEVLKQFRQIFNAIGRLKKNSGDINSILSDINQAMTEDEVNAMIHFINSSINNLEKNQKDAKQNQS
jgi:hypothetical protein